VLLVIVSVIIFKTIFSHMAFPVKQVRTSEEVEKNPSEKRVDIAK
jgi:hypothetical protein